MGEFQFETYVTLLVDGLLNLNILNVVTGLDVQDTVQVKTGLELANHEIILGISLDTLDGETTDPGVDLAGQTLGLGVASLQIEGLLAVESKDLSRRHNVATAEDSEVGVLIGDLGGLLPGEVDGVVDNVVDGEVTDTENGREGGTAESTATGDGLVLVEGERKTLAEELGDGLLDGGDTSTATNHLDVVNVVNGQLGLSESLLQRNGDSVQKRADHVLKLLTLDHGLDIGVLHQGLDAQGSLRVGGQNLLHLLGGSNGTGPGLGVGADVNLVLLLELIGEALGQSQVEVTTTEVAVADSGLDVQLTLAELDNAGGVITVTNVDEDDAAGLLLRTGEVQLGDTVSESGGGSVVNQAEDVETSNVTSIDHSAALDIGEPSGHTDGDIRDGKTELLGGDVLDLGQVHGNQLGCCELLLLTEVVNLDTGHSVDITDVGSVVLLLELDIGVIEGAADQALQGADGVLQVGGLLCLSSLTDVSAAGAESNEGSVGHKIFQLVMPFLDQRKKKKGLKKSLTR